jgi:hypothetical protein
VREFGEAVAGRLRHRDMGDEAIPEEALLAGEGAVDELVDDDEVPGGRSSRREPQADSDRMSVTPLRFRASILAR